MTWKLKNQTLKPLAICELGQKPYWVIAIKWSEKLGLHIGQFDNGAEAGKAAAQILRSREIPMNLHQKFFLKTRQGREDFSRVFEV